MRFVQLSADSQRRASAYKIARIPYAMESKMTTLPKNIRVLAIQGFATPPICHVQLHDKYAFRLREQNRQCFLQPVVG